MADFREGTFLTTGLLAALKRPILNRVNILPAERENFRFRMHCVNLTTEIIVRLKN